MITLCFSPNIVFDQIFVVYTLFLKRLRRWKQGNFVDFSAELWKGYPLIHPKKRGRRFCLILFSFLIMECCLIFVLIYKLVMIGRLSCIDYFVLSILISDLCHLN